mgnify:FL=1
MPEVNSTNEKKARGLNKGLLCAIPCLILSVVCLVCSRTYPKLQADYMQVSASFFPTVVSVMMVAMSVIMLIEAIVKPKYAEPLTPDQKKGYLRGLLAILNIIAYALLFKPLGYIVSSIIAVFLMMLIFGNRKWKIMIPISIILPIILYLVFYYLMQTALPAGILQFML